MDSTKYVSMDVHKDTISIAVMNSAGKVVMESVLETKALPFPNLEDCNVPRARRAFVRSEA
jgi:hypothetical protein